MQSGINILSIVPYSILPAQSGGKLTIRELHHYLGKICIDNLAGTTDNEDNTKYSFRLHKILPASKLRYLPYSGTGKLYTLAKQNNVQYVHTEHHYMGYTAKAVAKKLGVPWFIRSHNIESERFRSIGKSWWPVMRWFEQSMMRMANGIFFITQEDADWAVKNYGIASAKCHVIPHGTPLAAKPAYNPNAKAEIAQTLHIPTDVPWLYFLGALDYQPNKEALTHILNDIVPLLNAKGLKYQLLIAGKGLSDELTAQINAADNIHYLGFVPDLDTFLHACDVMLNPVMTGGGIKTKAVEALGYNKIVVSSEAGAAGLIPSACGSNLQIVPNYNWDAFATAVINATTTQPSIPDSFYDTYNWDKIAAKVLAIMQSTKA